MDDLDEWARGLANPQTQCKTCNNAGAAKRTIEVLDKVSELPFNVPMAEMVRKIMRDVPGYKISVRQWKQHVSECLNRDPKSP